MSVTEYNAFLILLLTFCGQQASWLPGDLLFGQTDSSPTSFIPCLEKANCRGCHVDNGSSGATRLHFPPESAAQGQVEIFGRSLRC